MIRTAYGYTRVSHSDSLNRGLSLATQDAIVRSRYEKLRTESPDIQWGGIFSDKAVSAFNNQFAMRPSAARLNSKLADGDVVICPAVDRAFRSAKDFFNTIDDWKDRGITFIFCDNDVDASTISGMSILYHAAIQAELLSHTISRKTKEGLRRKKQLAGHIGQASSIPTGTRTAYSSILRTRVVVPDETQRDVALEVARISREHPDWGDKKISDELEDWLAAKEGRRSFRGIRSRYRYSHRTICKLKVVAEEWETVGAYREESQ